MNDVDQTLSIVAHNLGYAAPVASSIDGAIICTTIITGKGRYRISIRRHTHKAGWSCEIFRECGWIMHFDGTTEEHWVRYVEYTCMTPSDASKFARLWLKAIEDGSIDPI